MTPPYEQPFAVGTPDERFESGAGEYAAYLRTVEGRLRLDLAWENVRAALAAHQVAPGWAGDSGGRAVALDLGCGTGALSVRLARAGWLVCAADPSPAMLDIADRAARDEGCRERVTFYRVEAERAAEAFGPRRFQLALCHNVLEYVRDPAETVRAVGQIMRPGGLVSLVARNRAGEAMRDAVRLHDLDSAERALAAETVRESLYGGPARLFDAESLGGLAREAGLETVAVRGVRVVSDYLPPALSETPELYARLLAFELRLGADPAFAPVARYTQLIARARGN